MKVYVLRDLLVTMFTPFWHWKWFGWCRCPEFRRFLLFKSRRNNENK